MIVVPTVDDFVNQFPEFLEVDEGRIGSALTLASTYISEDWIDVHQIPALLYLAAHILYYELSVSARLARIVSGSDQVAGPITAKTIGPLSVTYANTQANALNVLSGTSMGESPYLDQYQSLMRISFPPVLAVI